MIKYITNKGRKLGFFFTATTNGYDLDKYLDFFKENPYFSFQITVDGIEDIHNQRKPHFANNDSFQKITNNIDALLKIGLRVSIRINSDAYTITRIDELSSFFSEKGWYQYKNFRAYCALLRKEIPVNSKEWEHLKPLNQTDLYKFYYDSKIAGKLNDKLECQDYGIYHVLKDILLDKNIPYRGGFCGAQYGNLIFDPFGDVYPCWDVVGDPQYRVGQYVPKLKFDDGAIDNWFGLKPGDYKCAKCPYTLLCGGGCVIRSLNTKGVIEPGTCNDYPRLFNYMIKLIYNENIKENCNDYIG